MWALTILGVLLCSAGTYGDTFYKCQWVNAATVDCGRFSSDPTCGTDLVSYKNKCEFSKAHCADNTLNLKHYGNCTDAEVSTPAPGTDAGSDVVFDFMCTSLSHMDCPVGGEKVCASDGRPYDNFCEYEKQKCTHRTLQVIDCPV